MPPDADRPPPPGGPRPTRALVEIVGTAGSPWPVPGCRCAACTAAGGVPRAPSGLRLGDALLRGGTVTDAGGRRPLTAGDRFTSGGVRVAALPGPAGGPPAVVAGWPQEPAGTPDEPTPEVRSRTLLWAEGPGELPAQTVEALAGAGLDVVALDLRRADGTPGVLHLAHTLARLRAADAVPAGADVVALGLTHDLPPGPLAERLARVGARVAPDGSAPHPALSASGAVPAPARRTLVLGPASSGKSAVAEDLLAAEPAVDYAATGPRPGADDAAWTRRVEAHRSRRPAWWTTHETTDLAGLLTRPGPPLLVEALGTWVAATMDAARAWDDAPGWREEVQEAVDAVVSAWRQAQRRVVAVGEEVGWGLVPPDAGSAAFREVLGGLTQALAAQSERVLLVVAGRCVELGDVR